MARTDVVKTLCSVGAIYVNWQMQFIPYVPKFMRKPVRYVCDTIEAKIFLHRVQKGDEIYFQVPHLGKRLSSIVKWLKAKGAKLYFIIHDLDFLRYPNRISPDGIIAIINSADCIFVHTPQMEEKLAQIGVTAKMQPIMLFDYYAIDPYRDVEEQVKDRLSIAFAGNLNKSVFLRKLDESVVPDYITVKLYGVEPQIGYKNHRIVYQGKFKPEHTGKIHAGWGLVWDGDSIDTCSGDLGEYLKIIAPHKLSLYIASGIPVIVWSGSAHADFVRKNNIGIAVDSISDAYGLLSNLTVEEYKVMVHNTRLIGNKLRKGEFLKSVI